MRVRPFTHEFHYEMRDKSEQDEMLTRCLIDAGYCVFTIAAMQSTDLNSEYYVIYPAVEFFMHKNGLLFVYDESRTWRGSESPWMKSTVVEIHSAVRENRKQYFLYLERMRARHHSASIQRHGHALQYYMLERELRHFNNEPVLTTEELWQRQRKESMDA